MSLYDKHVLPYLLDVLCGMKAISKQREKVVPLAHGKVLEIGIGSGLNLKHYDQAKLEELHGLDPAMEMHRLAKKRMAKSGLDVELVGLPAEQIPMEDHSFDSIVCTYTLCTIPDPVQALREMRRVLKPEGQLLFCEHGKAPDASVAKWQDKLNNAWGKIAGGCNMNRPIPSILEEGGFDIRSLETMYVPGGPKMLTYNYWGSAQILD